MENRVTSTEICLAFRGNGKEEKDDNAETLTQHVGFQPVIDLCVVSTHQQSTGQIKCALSGISNCEAVSSGR